MNELPSEMVQAVLQWTKAHDMLSVQLVCRRWHEVTKLDQQALWRNVYLYTWPPPLTSPAAAAEAAAVVAAAVASQSAAEEKQKPPARGRGRKKPAAAKKKAVGWKALCLLRLHLDLLRTSLSFFTLAFFVLFDYRCVRQTGQSGSWRWPCKPCPLKLRLLWANCVRSARGVVMKQPSPGKRGVGSRRSRQRRRSPRPGGVVVPRRTKAVKTKAKAMMKKTMDQCSRAHSRPRTGPSHRKSPS